MSLKKGKPRLPIMTHESLEGHDPGPINTHHAGLAAFILTMVGPDLGCRPQPTSSLILGLPKASEVPPQMACRARSSLAYPALLPLLHLGKMPSSLLPPIP